MPDDIPAYRTISREYPDGRRVIASVEDTGVIDPENDERVLDWIEAAVREEPTDPAS